MLKHGIDINEKPPVHKAAGLLEDWPVGRGVFIQDSGDFFVLVNFEDHLKFVVVPSATNDFVDALSTITKSLITFEQLAYATDQFLGNLTTDPANLGTAFSISTTVTDKPEV